MRFHKPPREPWLDANQFEPVVLGRDRDSRLHPETGDIHLYLTASMPEFYIEAGHMVLNASVEPVDAAGRHWVGLRNTDKVWGKRELFVSSQDWPAGGRSHKIIGRAATSELRLDMTASRKHFGLQVGEAGDETLVILHDEGSMRPTKIYAPPAAIERFQPA
jgi:hypothetical protein